MLDQMPPWARIALVLGLVGLGALGAYFNTRSDVVVLPDTGAIVEAEVTLDGQPLPYAVVILQGDPILKQGNLEGGKVRIESAPVGKVKVGVNTALIRGQMMGMFMAAAQGGRDEKGNPIKPPTIIDVPGKYFDPSQSGLEYDIVKGVNRIKVELTKS